MPKSRFWKLALILAVILGVSGSAFYFGLLSPDFWQAVRQERLSRQIWNELEAQKRREAQDPYGGQTPQEVYQLFVQALEKQDIDLAVKYFAFEKQGTIEESLTNIRDQGKWQIMYDDFSGKTARIEYDAQEGGEYDIKIRAVTYDINRTGLRAVIRAERNPNSNLWKLTEFW